MCFARAFIVELRILPATTGFTVSVSHMTPEPFYLIQPRLRVSKLHKSPREPWTTAASQGSSRAQMCREGGREQRGT